MIDLSVEDLFTVRWDTRVACLLLARVAKWCRQTSAALHIRSREMTDKTVDLFVLILNFVKVLCCCLGNINALKGGK